MATTPSIRVVKSFLYRGVLREWSNRYHFSGGVPANSTQWTTLSDAIVTAEKAVHIPQGSGGSKIVATFGFEAGSEIPVFSKTYSTDGTMSVSGSLNPGDACTLVRYSTAARSSKNHPIYMFSYYHGGQNTGGYAGNDQVRAGDITAHNTYATLWDTTGFSDGSHTVKRSSPSGHDATGHVVEPLVTHRDLPR